MLRASLILLVVGLASVSAFGAGGSGAGTVYGRGRGGLGGKLGGTGSVDTEGSVSGKASLGHGSLFGGLFDFSDAQVEGEAGGHLQAEGTAGAQFSAGGGGEGYAAGRGQANVGF